MYLLVGLGNPGKRYEDTRHNVGFIVIDVIADMLGIKVNKIKFSSLLGEGACFARGGKSEKVILLKPQTFMNASGEAVKAAADYYGIPEEKIIVIYDDVDLAAGDIRIRPKGSSGTHNGMRNILYHLETERFPRVRVGIGGEMRNRQLYEYVLSRFEKDEAAVMRDAFLRAAKAAIAIVEEGTDFAMNTYNVRGAQQSDHERGRQKHERQERGRREDE